MTQLDDVEALRALDAGDMLGAVASLPRHAREGYDLAIGTDGLPLADGVTGIAFCGMGGSGIAGDVLRATYGNRLTVPIQVVRSPVVPAWVGPHSLVVCSSYSGGTAETLSCFEEARDRGARIVPITSGGRLAKRSAELGIAAVRVPGGFLPRAALGFLLFALLGALERIGLLPRLSDDVHDAVAVMDPLVEALGPAVPTERNDAKALAARIGRRQPVIWGADGVGSAAAYRWKTQMNENGKVPAWAASLPELDHNEVVGWSDAQGDDAFVVALRDEAEHPDVSVRFPISLEIARDAGAATEEVWATGRNRLSRFLSLGIMGDYTSCYLGLAHGVDPSPIDAIVRLKAFLDEATAP
ncbi:MAG TPA: bifunctional phosphoglucose/phosphomannose isomerase [Actinomycetota bacterium]|nr:bifunctional phosphoglucose/phosphomannose isomerase [Actinomycetota bacterium]